MPTLKIQDFSGAIPVKGDRAIPDAFGVASINTWLYGSELRGIRPPELIIACLPTTRRVFRIPKRTVGGDPAFPTLVPPPSYLGDSVWVQFTDHDTDVVKGQLIEDQWERYYFCSPTTGPVFNTYQRLRDGLPMYKLGVPAVNTAPPIVGVTGGTANIVTRAYVYTWVNEFGEESAPSLPTTFAGYSDAVWNISGILDPVGYVPPTPFYGGDFAGFAGYTKKRLYRTITGLSGQTTFYRVAEIPAGTTTYDDSMADTVLAGNLKLESVSWQPPPSTLKGFIAMPNGFLIGFDGNNIYMSESYHFHAWPAEYKQASETPIVGLGVLGQTCVVCTQGYPATITGAKPATCSFTKATTGEPCLGRGSIVSGPQGVIYASQNGLILVGPGGINNVTEQIITREEWLREFAPAYLRGVRYQNGYLAVRMLPVESAVPRSGFFLDPTDLKVALTELSDFEDCKNLNTDFWSGDVLFLTSSKINRWDPPSSNLMPVQWRSKEFQYPLEANFGCYAIYWDEARYSNFNYGTSIMPVDEHVRFKVWADRQVVYDQVVRFNGEPMRLPSGFKADIWQFEIKARAPVYSLHVASTMKELRQI